MEPVLNRKDIETKLVPLFIGRKMIIMGLLDRRDREIRSMETLNGFMYSIEHSSPKGPYFRVKTLLSPRSLWLIPSDGNPFILRNKADLSDGLPSF